MNQVYLDYIKEWGSLTGESRDNNCINVSVQMKTNFPELILRIGYLKSEKGGIDTMCSHCWLETAEGEVIDPSLCGYEEDGVTYSYEVWDEKSRYLVPDWCSFLLIKNGKEVKELGSLLDKGDL